VDSSPAQPANDDAAARLLRRIEAIAADIDTAPQPSPVAGTIEALAGRLQAAFDERLAALEETLEGLSERLESLGRDNAAEVAALREDLADALEELSAGLLERMSQIQAGLPENPATDGS
jgi:division protein CdvB (Snf7/Vps24/ESCRT-III family)